MGTHNTECVVKLQGANTEKFGPKSSSQVCLLGKGPLQPPSFQDIAEVLQELKIITFFLKVYLGELQALLF